MGITDEYTGSDNECIAFQMVQKDRLIAGADSYMELCENGDWKILRINEERLELYKRSIFPHRKTQSEDGLKKKIFNCNLSKKHFINLIYKNISGKKNSTVGKL